MITLNYGDLQRMVTAYRTTTAAPLNWALALDADILGWYNDLQTLPCNGFRIYLAIADSGIMDTAGNQVIARNCHGCIIMIAVPTERNAQNDVDDLIEPNGTIKCFTIGWSAFSDNMGMCPPMCAAIQGQGGQPPSNNSI